MSDERPEGWFWSMDPARFREEMARVQATSKAEDLKAISAARKAQPIATGVLAYFSRALAAVAEVSRKGNEKHNPGEALRWAKEKSTDEADACVRHICDALREGPMALDAEGVPHLRSAAWRMLAWLERVEEGDDRWKGVAKPTGGK